MARRSVLDRPWPNGAAPGLSCQAALISLIHSAQKAMSAPADSLTASKPSAMRAASAMVNASPTSATSGSSQAFSVSHERRSVSAICGRRRTPTRLTASTMGQAAMWKRAWPSTSSTVLMPIMRNIMPAIHSSTNTLIDRQTASARCTVLRHAARNTAG